MKHFFQELIQNIKNTLVSDELRKKVLFSLVNGALAITALVMSVINYFTAEYMLFIATSTYCMVCLINIWLLNYTRINKKFPRFAFCIESMALLLFLLISGVPNGFGALWICLVPSFALLVLGMKMGGAFSALVLLEVIFLFWTPCGRSLLMYSYTDEFMLRLPFLYTSFFVISLVIEWVRRETQKQLEQVKENYYHLYRHDALTGLYNRYGINEFFQQASKEDANANPIAIIIFDIDNFKEINDIYGHECGDEVLKGIAKILLDTADPHCRCCRWGGEELLLLMQRKDDAAALAESIRKKIEQLVILHDGERVYVTISVGVCAANNLIDTNIHNVIDKADHCLYESKANGKNRVTTCET